MDAIIVTFFGPTFASIRVHSRFGIGGHLSFRAAMNPEVLAGVCFYATDIHKRGLAKGTRDNSLDRIPDVRRFGSSGTGPYCHRPRVPTSSSHLIVRT